MGDERRGQAGGHTMGGGEEAAEGRKETMHTLVR